MFLDLFTCVQLISFNSSNIDNTTTRWSNLENSRIYDFHPELDLGITIDLINAETYEKEKNDTLDPADEKLLEEDVEPKIAKR